MKEKYLYVAPECEQITIATQGVLAQSPIVYLTVLNAFQNTEVEEEW